MSRARLYSDKADMFSIGIIIGEIVTTYMFPAPREYEMNAVLDMAEAAAVYLEPISPAMARLVRNSASDVPTQRPTAVDMLAVLNSPEVVAACTGVAGPVVVMVPAAAVRLHARVVVCTEL